MSIEFEVLLGRTRGRLAPARAAERVHHRDVACLEAELGRPLPRILAVTWTELGAPRLAVLGLWSPQTIAAGLPMAERWLDDGYLPFATAAEGDLLLLRLAGTSSADDDPCVVLGVDFPKPVRVEVGPLSRVLVAHLLVHLAQTATGDIERRAIAAKLEQIDGDGRLRDPLGWAKRVAV